MIWYEMMTTGPPPPSSHNEPLLPSIFQSDILNVYFIFPRRKWNNPSVTIPSFISVVLQGHTLFQTHDNMEHLAMMTRILGDFPSHIVRRTKTNFFHGVTGRLCWDWSLPAARYATQHCRPLPQYRRSSPHSILGQEESVMLDLIARMLEYEPDRRMTLKEALRHPFFDRLSGFQKPEDISKHILRLQI